MHFAGWSTQTLFSASHALQQFNHCVAFQCSRQQNKVNIRMECQTKIFHFPAIWRQKFQNSQKSLISMYMYCLKDEK